MVYRNGSAGTTYYGIYLNQPSGAATIRNNTLVDNQNEGIRLDGPNSPSVRNCILYANHADGGYADTSGIWGMQYCCLTDANDLQRTATATGHNGNLRGNPMFAYSDRSLGNFHLSYNSPCKNVGSNTGVGVDETDIDQDERIIDGTVDIGADEVACEDISHSLDWNADGVVNFIEFEKYSLAWMTCDPNRPGGTSGYDPNDLQRWNPKCDLDQDFDIDLADLVIFAEDNPQNWLWVACWRKDLQPEQLEMMMSMTPAGGMQMQSLSLSDSTSVKATIITPEKPICEQIIELKDTIQFLERIWLEDDSIQQDIDAGEWRQFMEKVYQNMSELQNMKTKSFDLKGVEQ
jgi:parallel beta-helix repeat protein